MGGRQPPVGVLGADHPVTGENQVTGVSGARRGRRATRSPLVVLVVLALVLLAGCTGAEPQADPAPTAVPVPPTATAVPAPPRNVCHAMTWDQALAPTDTSRTVPCEGEHTAETFSVGELKTVVDGHLLAVDSTRVQAQAAAVCPRRLSRLVGGTRDDLRLSMLRAIWFTPTVEESDQGGTWLRCDAIVVAREGTLAPVRGSLRDALANPARRAALAMCATAQPGAADFTPVLCREPHTWRAVEVVDLGGGAYPGRGRVRAAGRQPCEAAGRRRASDALDFRWGYEWPTAEQWATGQTWGRCWAPDPA